jgi:maleylpyruvate isomerase
MRHGIAGMRIGSAKGLTALEAMLGCPPGPFCSGEAPGLADIYLVPQLANARRFNRPLDAYPSPLRAESAALTRPEFRDAAPEKQSDAG